MKEISEKSNYGLEPYQLPKQVVHNYNVCIRFINLLFLIGPNYHNFQQSSVFLRFCKLFMFHSSFTRFKAQPHQYVFMLQASRKLSILILYCLMSQWHTFKTIKLVPEQMRTWDMKGFKILLETFTRLVRLVCIISSLISSQLANTCYNYLRLLFNNKLLTFDTNKLQIK